MNASQTTNVLRITVIAVIVVAVSVVVVTLTALRASDATPAEQAPDDLSQRSWFGAPADDPEQLMVELPPTPTVAVGVAIGDLDPVVLDRFIATTSVIPDFVDVYKAWGDSPDFEPELDRQLARRGVRMKITWEPWAPVPSGKAGADQPDYALATIAAGDHDPYIRRWAESIADHERPITMRLMHEMNGDWYPWGEGVNGNTPGDYVAAWRHVWTIFVEENAEHNVVWEWAPNEKFQGSSPLEPLYPGDEYVDEIGISAYNWGDGTVGPVRSRWREFGPMISPTLDIIAEFANRPIGVSETGSSGNGGDRAKWIEGMFDDALKRELAFITYFELKTQLDWRISADPAVVDAFASGFALTRAAK